MSSEQWVAQLEPLTTPEYVVILRGIDLARLSATTVTGPPVPVRVEDGLVTVITPTNTDAVKLVLWTEAGTWRVRNYDLADDQ